MVSLWVYHHHDMVPSLVLGLVDLPWSCSIEQRPVVVYGSSLSLPVQVESSVSSMYTDGVALHAAPLWIDWYTVPGVLSKHAPGTGDPA